MKRRTGGKPEYASKSTGSPTLTTTATASSAPGTYPIAVGLGTLAAGNYTFNLVNNSLTVTQAPLPAAGVNFNATAGAPFSGPVATFTNADPFGNAASYAATITWGDGSSSAGAISGSGSTLTVTGSHTYADPVTKAVSVQIRHKLGYTTTAIVGDTATVTSLGIQVQNNQTQEISFWNRDRGQALINSFNGGASHTELSTWLASTFANLYGANAGSYNLIGKTNAQVAALFQSLWDLHHDKLDVQVLATALSVYATTASLGGSQGQLYGFQVTATGLGANSFNVGRDGAAFGVANDATLNVYQLLKAVNQGAVNGVLYNGDAHLCDLAQDLLKRLN